jgi:L-ascorbate metabolism protein UlaG (beta-lactamase superfamily)
MALKSVVMKSITWLLLLCLAAFADDFSTAAGVVKITPIRHACLMVEAGGQVAYLDPAQGNFDSSPKADLILLTDTHGDHLAPAVLEKLKKPGTAIVGPEAVAKTVPGTKILRNGEKTTVGKWEIEAVAAYNLKRGPSPGAFYHEKGRGNGYIVTWGGKRFYFAGDTEGIPEMRAVKNIEVAFVPMNLPFTMTAEEAADAVKAFQPKIVYPYHYRGTDLSVFEKALAGTGIEVRLRDWYK